ncbi:MAG: hypothetical protein K2G37_01565 [Clostridia bacterium]|nr:hypothetical protein [Clostridia bacterium]MDE7329143.1 hypothetical protein [Clostridia bacterium]
MKLFFDKPKGIILINGNKCNESYAVVDKRFFIAYVPFDYSLEPIFYASDGKICGVNELCFIKHGKDFIVKFCPAKKPVSLNEDLYFQKIVDCQGGASHCLSCKCKESHRIVVETQNEIHFLDVICKVVDCDFKVAPISNGQLLSVVARLENGKTFVTLLHYLDDYTPLLTLYCDEFSCADDCITVCDSLDDTLARKCVRRIAFCEDSFVEQSRHFEYSCRHNYVDELIPYVFLESLNCGDRDCMQNCLSYNMKDFDFKGFFGDFIEICDCLKYKPYEITLIYSERGGFYTKSFRFFVAGGKITKINLI